MKEYQAGICNIGEQEVTYRRRIVGWGVGLIAAAFYGLLVFFNFPLIFYIFLLIPVFISVHGFTQANNRFCTSYAKAGKYNMASEVGLTQDVISRIKHKDDIARANALIRQSTIKTVIIVVPLVLIARWVN